VRTAPTTSASYTVNLADGQAATGNDFDNFHKPNTGAVTNVSFQVTDNGTTKTVTNLRGQTHQGDTVTVNFTVSTSVTSATVTLVAYDAPGPSFDANTASQQVPIQIVGDTFAPGQHSLTVVLPQNYYQVDFVAGSAITQLGPAGSNIFYSAQGRLISADNGGTNPVPPPTASLSGTVFSDNSGSGVVDATSTGLQGVTVTLTGTVNGQAVTLTTTTDANGNYSFTGVVPGTYTVQVTAPITYTNETASAPSGSASTGVISNVVLTPGVNASSYDFLEGTPPTS
jgi:hypothetical protein